jgi:hypothetical protein
MSLNIHIEAYNSENVIPFDCIQTTTNETHEIMCSDDPLCAYKEYIRGRFKPERLAIYDPEDIHDTEIIGYADIDFAQEHIESLDKWINTNIKNGYSIRVVSY